ncbi:hypothetical protein HT662_04020 [Ursidibacter maritimus]|nr:hypothetical protein [Ursidibacter maritimus]
MATLRHLVQNSHKLSPVATLSSKFIQTVAWGDTWFKIYTNCRQWRHLVQNSYKLSPVATLGSKFIQTVASGDT